MGEQHVLEVYEPYEYKGQNPLTVEGVTVLKGPMRDNYYLLRLDTPVEYDHEMIEMLLVLPHYNGDEIDRAVNSTCTVNIARVPCDSDIADKTRVSFEDFQRWGVGKISLNNHS
ncbi:MAG: hypothetical protein BMS9Abin08_1034 [Gammaproteobacteria bacterium]|nr:MAG: hypothetical protein BMS9Abin08_1034 [Gammaproteobacteria bacterium]